jgi:2-deoxy-D-gluconate 3-dehydrogenase
VTSERFSVAARVVVVTGGNGGLGLTIAAGLAREGARVAVTGRNEAKNAQARRHLGPDSLVLVADVTDEASVRRAIRAVTEQFGRVDVLVNNAGNFAGGAISELSLEAWQSVIGTHLTGSFLCAKHAAAQMRNQGDGGKIINVGSVYSVFGPPDFANYAAAKTGILGLTRALAVELAPDRIQVNAILPGWFETDLTRGMPDTKLGTFIRDKTPARRWGTGDDLIGPVTFLASTASDFVTSAALPVDGGSLIADRTIGTAD